MNSLTSLYNVIKTHFNGNNIKSIDNAAWHVCKFNLSQNLSQLSVLHVTMTTKPYHITNKASYRHTNIECCYQGPLI